MQKIKPTSKTKKRGKITIVSEVGGKKIQSNKQKSPTSEAKVIFPRFFVFEVGLIFCKKVFFILGPT